MGVRKFFPWLAKMGYVPESDFFVSVRHSLIVDVKTFMYQFGYRVPLDDPDYCKTIADAIIAQFKMFEHVTFVNDGAIDAKHPKFETVQKRAETRQNSKRKNAAVRVTPNLDEAAIDKLDRAERAARGVSLQQSKCIMEHLAAAAQTSFVCIQCEGEADDYIAAHHKDFDLVVSQDSDFVVAGVACLLCNMGTAKQALFRNSSILAKLQITQEQLQEIAAMAGNDYTLVGIRGMGLEKAYDMIQKYGSCRNMLSKWTKDEQSRITVEPAFYALFNRSMLTYTRAANLLDVPQTATKLVQDQEEPTNITSQQHAFFDLFVSNKRFKKTQSEESENTTEHSKQHEELQNSGSVEHG